MQEFIKKFHLQLNLNWMWSNYYLFKLIHIYWYFAIYERPSWGWVLGSMHTHNTCRATYMFRNAWSLKLHLDLSYINGTHNKIKLMHYFRSGNILLCCLNAIELCAWNGFISASISSIEPNGKYSSSYFEYVHKQTKL